MKSNTRPDPSKTILHIKAIRVKVRCYSRREAFLYDNMRLSNMNCLLEKSYLPAEVHDLNGVLIVKSRLLSSVEKLFHGFFCRSGGVSRGVFRSLNVAYSVGDDIKNVKQNIEIVRNISGFKEIVQCHQVHGTKVIFYDGRWEENIPQGDVLISSAPGLGLMIKTGDCQAVFIVDPVRKAVAAVHCGWRGLVKNVIKHAVKALRERFDSSPSSLIAAIGPSLGPCCAEFVNYAKEFPKSFWKYRIGRNHFDLWQIAKDQLTECGVSPRSIDITGWCTKCNPELFFSYRRRKVSGRMAAVVGFLEGKK